MAPDTKLDLSTVIDGLGHGVLIFSSDGRLIKDNLGARTFLGATDYNTIRDAGWEAAAVLFDTQKTDPDEMVHAVRDRALKSERPIRFHIFHSGEYIPCWASAIQTTDGEVATMITIDTPDWNATSVIIDKFRAEMRDAISSTQGHIDIINKTIKHNDPKGGVEGLSRRINGFTRLISVHMYRVDRLNNMLERLEKIRTGKVKNILKERRYKIKLGDFFEDFLEELDEIMLVDPETEARDHRSRIQTEIPDDLAILASGVYLTRILHDMLRNAIMYSMRGTPIRIVAIKHGTKAEIKMIDEGYGVRDKERERVFEEFKRARQPQIISEFGYGISLYLCKHEIEAMNGTMVFDSTENVGTTFTFTLPLWKDETDSSSSSSSSDKTKSNPTTT